MSRKDNASLSAPVPQGTLGLLEAALSRNEVDHHIDLPLWHEIKEELKVHAVFSLVGDVVMDSNLPNSEKLEAAKATATNIRAFHKLMKAQAAVLELLRENNIPVAVMKGAAAAQYYPRPELRQYGDIDILVLPDDHSRAFDLLLSAGYIKINEHEHIGDRHIGFVAPDGSKVELHRTFSSGSSPKQDALLDSMLYDALRYVTQIHISGYDVPVFPTLENGLILLSHIKQHLNTGLGLRQIIDWLYFARAQLTDESLNEQFFGKAEVLGLTCLAKTVTEMCRKYLGLEFTRCADVDDKTVDDLMLYILKKGNFGHKIEEDSRRTIAVAHRLTNPVAAFRYLTETGKVHMAEAGLKPRVAYAWLYQIGHLLRMSFSLNSKSAMAKDIHCAIGEAELLKRLKLN